MEINFKLIPYQNNPNNTFTLVFETKEIKFKDIIRKFIEKGFLVKYNPEVKFISNGRQFTSMDDVVDTNYTNFFLFTNNVTAKQNLLDNIFTHIGKEEPLQIQSVVSVDEEPLEEECIEINIDEINDQIIEEITPELLKLLHTCVSKPDLLRKVNSYLQSGNIQSPIEINNIDDEEFKYNNAFSFIVKKFSIYNWDENTIKNVLNYYSGHINLTIRYMINSSLCNKNF